MTDHSQQAAARIAEYAQMNPRAQVQHDGVTMTFSTPSLLTLQRVQSIRTKEPCTLEWIASFDAEDILLDVGANVGMYTVWAAATRRVRVLAFEPEAQNYALLNRNIMLNDLGERVTAFCLGLSDHSGLTRLNMADLRVGGSLHAVGEPLDFKLQPMRVAFAQGCVVAELDELVAAGQVPVPTHIKIDVDGFEHRVAAGAAKTLQDPAVKSILVEINQNLPEHLALVQRLERLGFTYAPDQVAAAARNEGPFGGLAEYVFRR